VFLNSASPSFLGKNVLPCPCSQTLSGAGNWKALIQYSVQYSSSYTTHKQECPSFAPDILDFPVNITIYCTVLAVLVEDNGLSHSLLHTFIPRPPSVLQLLGYKQFSHTTVLTIALSRATPIAVLSRTLGAFDCRLISFARRLAAD
jgi:hypothetical protein